MSEVQNKPAPSAEPKQLKDFSLMELKAMAYDRIAHSQRLQTEIAELNRAIAERG